MYIGEEARRVLSEVLVEPCSHESGGLEEAGHDGIRQQFIAATALYRDQSPSVLTQTSDQDCRLEEILSYK